MRSPTSRDEERDLLVALERGELGDGREGRGQPGGEPERHQDAEDRRPRDAAGSLGEQQGHDGHEGAAADGEQDRVGAAQQEGHDELDDDRQRQRQRDQRARAAPSADDDDHGREDRGHHAQHRDPPRLGNDREVAARRPGEPGDDDLVADLVWLPVRRTRDGRAAILDHRLDPLAVVELDEKERKAGPVSAALLDDDGVVAALPDDRDGIGRREVRQQPERRDQGEADDDRRQRGTDPAGERAWHVRVEDTGRPRRGSSAPAESHPLGEDCRLVPAAHPELAEDIAHVDAGSALGHEQLVADLAIAAPADEQGQHLPLAAREAQPIGGVVGAAGPPGAPLRPGHRAAGSPSRPTDSRVRLKESQPHLENLYFRASDC